MNIFTLLEHLLTYLTIYYIYCIYRNVQYAQRTGLKYIISPITPHSLHWRLLTALFRPQLQRFRWFRAIDWTCAWQDGDALHEELGSCFFVVSPGHNVLCTADGKTIECVLTEWRDFVKPDGVIDILGIFGDNVDASNGDDWNRHRKLIAPCFSERASAAVWQEAREQSEDLLKNWLSPGNDQTNNIVKDTRTLALNVISSIAFGNHQVNKPTAGHALSLRDSLDTIMSTSVSPTLEKITPWLRTSGLDSLLPASIKKLLLASSEFRQYMDEIITRERQNPSTKETKAPRLISTLIKANDDTRADKTSASSALLSDDELKGNVFIFTVGGLESTAATMSYAFALLALNPNIQDWVFEEVQEVFGDGEVEYAKVFPRLKRVMAVMYETLRLYSPSPPLPRAPIDQGLEIPTSMPPSTESTSSTTNPPPSRTITLPPNTHLMLNTWSSHVSPTNFPSTPHTWNPKRWVRPSVSPSTSKSKTKSPTSSSLQAETLLPPTPSSGFLAWGSGPRICPGMKFSQVEFTAALATVLSKMRVQVAVQEGETEEQARERVGRALRDSVAEPLLLHVRREREREVGVRFVGR